MQRERWSILLFTIFVLAASIFYLRGVPGVPFHPDEATQLFMSDEITRLLQDPADLFWSAARADDLRQHYRVMDAPVVRYLSEAIRTVAGYPILAQDWDWTQTWTENQARGALPDARLLRVCRAGLALLFPLDLALIYAIGKRLHGHLAGWLAAILLAANALILLHTRRVMAEGILLFVALLATWALLAWGRRAWLAAAPLALAFCAKHSAIAMLPGGLLAVLWAVPGWRGFSKRAAAAAGFAALFGLVTLALNPFLWSHPIAAALDVVAARSSFTAEMAGMVAQVSPESVQNTLSEKLIAMMAQLFFTPPAIMDVANYAAELRTDATIYLSNPLHSLLRGIGGGALILGISLFGFALALRNAARRDEPKRRDIVILITVTLAWASLLSVSIPVPFQRYYLPLVPYTCLWAAYGIAALMKSIHILR